MLNFFEPVATATDGVFIAGTCVSSCPSSAIKGRHFTDQQIFAEIEGVLAAGIQKEAVLKTSGQPPFVW